MCIAVCMAVCIAACVAMVVTLVVVAGLMQFAFAAEFQEVDRRPITATRVPSANFARRG
jgi:uncharacterized protein with FMN-binding domain